VRSTTLEPIEVALADLPLRTAAGDPVKLGDIVDRPTVLVMPRYYGCLPCRGYLKEVSARLDDVEAAGGAALAVSRGADFQARWLAEEQGIRFPLLVDPERRINDAVDLPRKWWINLNPKGWWNYAKAIFEGNRQGRIIEPNQLPGLALLDAHATAVRIHRGSALGDYPPFDHVMRELREMSGHDQAS
jgi:peroxiredoxin